MKKNEIVTRLVGALIGFVIPILFFDLISKPDNMAVSFHPIESLSGYFFGFVYLMGDFGWLVGGLLLLAYLALFYFLAGWIYKKIFRNK